MRFSGIFHAKALRKENLKIHWYSAFQQDAGIAVHLAALRNLVECGTKGSCTLWNGRILPNSILQVYIPFQLSIR